MESIKQNQREEYKTKRTDAIKMKLEKYNINRKKNVNVISIKRCKKQCKVKDEGAVVAGSCCTLIYVPLVCCWLDSTKKSIRSNGQIIPLIYIMKSRIFSRYCSFVNF